MLSNKIMLNRMSFLKEIFLYLQDKVLEKTRVLENGLCKLDFGVTLTHYRKGALGYVLRSSWVLYMIN